VRPKKRDCLHKSAAIYPILAQGDAQFVLYSLLGTCYESVWLSGMEHFLHERSVGNELQHAANF